MTRAAPKRVLPASKAPRSPRLKTRSRPYDATKTRQRILESARRCFTDRGFDHVGLRDIAAGASADPALVIRYFGSKEKLFIAAIGTDFDLLDYWGDDPDKVGERLADRIIMAKASSECYDPLLLILRSSPNAKAAALLKAKIQKDVIEPMAARLSGPDAPLRANAITAVLIGLAFAKDVVQLDAMAAASNTQLKRHYARLIQCCVAP